MKIYNIIIAGAIALVALPSLANGQCNGFTKKHCKPKVAPFTHNGQMNSAVLAEGESAELLLTFYAGQNYRLVVCADDQKLSDVSYRLLDTKRKELFNSVTHGNPISWDFNVQHTQQILVEINVPKGGGKSTTVAMIPTGCVSILVGFKE